MVGDRDSEMDPEQIRAFLGRGGTGVLSLAADDVPYSIPVSYGFNPEERTFYFRLGFGDDSEKRRAVTPPAQARLVVYEQGSDRWTSVIATGTLEHVEDEELTTEIASSLQQADLPLLGMWDAPPEEIEFEIYRFDVEQLSGRQTADAAV